jgi:molybdenum cofactor cytidylyltransferase
VHLAHALRLADGEIVALTGAGGKTAALFRLADDVVERGGRVITTVTTHLGVGQLARAPRHFSAFEANRARVAAALEKHAHVLVTGPVDQALGKARGVTAGLVADLHLIPDLAAIIVEADGSRQLPFKAPAGHEPAIPDCATLVVVVAGLSALGRPLAEDQVHRPELIARLAGVQLGDPVTPEVMARVLAHPEGGLKGAPAGARVCILLNQAESEETLLAGRNLATKLLRLAPVEAVLLGSARKPDAVREVHGRAAAVVLAAGRSTRMGRPKQLLPWGGTTLLGAVVRRLRATEVSDIVVVTGAERAAVEASLAGELAADPRLRCVFNPDFAAGEMARSLQTGLQALPADRTGALVVLADQPELEPRVVQALLQRWRETLAPALAPYYQGQRGHPLLFDRALWPAILALPAAANPREALRAAGAVEPVDVDTASILRDIDTPDDYAAAAPSAS